MSDLDKYWLVEVTHAHGSITRLLFLREPCAIRCFQQYWAQAHAEGIIYSHAHEVVKAKSGWTAAFMTLGSADGLWPAIQ